MPPVHRHHPPRRRSSSVPNRLPRKKALVIGIQYSKTAQVYREQWQPLLGPHKDADAFKHLLIDKYGYREENIVVMLDDGKHREFEPTRAHLLREFRALVRKPQSGDEFVLFYAGHSEQIPNKTHTEDDGSDEVILPKDHQGLDEKHLIRDSSLRRILVDHLPPGARLTAIFDSCHSGTMLDLPHYNCNSIESRENSFETKWHRNFPQRKNAVHLHGAHPAEGGTATAMRVLEAARRQSGEIAMTEHCFKASTPARRRTDSLMGVPGAEHAPAHRKTSHGDSAERATSAAAAKRRTDSLVLMTDADCVASPLKTSHVPASFLERREGRMECAEPEEIRQCASPTTSVRECNGKCHLEGGDEDEDKKADVISLAACRDYQFTYENYKGDFSFTQGLVAFLNLNPYPTYYELMSHISRERSRILRAVCQEFTHEMNESNPLEKYQFRERLTFSRPILGSEKRLDMKSNFRL
ncbi:hypothetical protein OBBRIDRAFT_215726 [Obba rivulosa]|uniref:Peptidase C14 caspase domain-containing protein n=1 Tax=Obba rivulosa TaxID=1052685 RepID=A0A8E2DQV7_9APHY|nr:hypothetical protein OBBRIDRAFT_215726 [Obba rivulosa]